MIFTLEFTCVSAFLLLLVFLIYTYWSYFLATILIYWGLKITQAKMFKRTLDIGQKGILITGCDTGFGYYLAKRLDDKGYTVFAGVLNLNSSGVKALQARHSKRLHMIKLDVTKDEDVRRSLVYINETEKGLWGVVNNAGINLPGDVELTTMDQFIRCVAINLYGTIRVTKATLPLVRKAKGRIVNISSVRGRIPLPGDSSYVLSKHGVEAVSDSLRIEMRKFGVKVCLIEPGQYGLATCITSPEQLKRIKKEIDYMWDQASDDVKRTYGRTYFESIYKEMENRTWRGQTMSADPVLDAIEDALINENPEARYLVPGSISFIDRNTARKITQTKMFKKTIDIGQKGILITGCDTGFGYYLAKRLDDKGYTVFAGVLNLDSNGVKALQARQSKRLHIIKLDVTKDDDVRRSMVYINEREKGLWAVVNNAGINLPGDVELTTMDQFIRCADINLYGTIRVTKATLPLVRKAKGRIVNISSVRGLIPLPGDSSYVLSKHGLEAVSDSLRTEMRKFGVKVCLIEPGKYGPATCIISPEQLKRIKKELDHMWNQASDDVKRTYGRTYFENIYKEMENKIRGGQTMSADPVLDAIEDALINVNPKARYLVPGSISFIDSYTLFAKVYNYLPHWLSDWILLKLAGDRSIPK